MEVWRTAEKEEKDPYLPLLHETTADNYNQIRRCNNSQIEAHKVGKSPVKSRGLLLIVVTFCQLVFYAPSTPLN